MALRFYTDPGPRMSEAEVSNRVGYLRGLYDSTLTQRTRIRQIMDGGIDAVWAILGDKLKQVDELTPIPPLMVSGLSKLGQKIGGQVPRLKVPAYGKRLDSASAKANAEKRERIVESYDQGANLEMLLPQLGRWLPGYGFGVMIVKDGFDEDGSLFPDVELRDTYDCYPGVWTVNQQPRELAVVYSTPEETLRDIYPELELPAHPVRPATPNYRRLASGAVILDIPTVGGGGWGNQADVGITVAEYYCPEGTYVVLPDYDLGLDFTPNPVAPHNRFVLFKRFAFNRMVGAYDHVVGLMSMMAKIDILQYIFMEDAVMTETNIYGDGIDARQYHRGRGATNVFPAGTRVEKPIANMPYQVFQLVDRIERRLRIGASYPVSDDSQAPVSYLTGRGLERLEETRDSEVAEYHKIIRHGLQALDALRLRWDEVRGRGSRALVGYRDGVQFAETYTPRADIAGRYRTVRKHGFMAGWDDSAKIVGGLQLLQAEAIDIETFQENMDGLENRAEIGVRLHRHSAQQAIYDMLRMQAAQADPMDPTKQTKAQLALVEIIERPEDFTKILRKHFTPESPQYSEEEEAFLAGQMGMPGQPGGEPLMSEQPPDITTVLSQLNAGRAAEGGVQTVGRL